MKKVAVAACATVLIGSPALEQAVPQKTLIVSGTDPATGTICMCKDQDHMKTVIPPDGAP